MQPVIYDINLNSLSGSEIRNIHRQVMRETVVVFKNQKLQPDDEYGICSAVGEIEDSDDPRYENIRVHKGIIRVTGKKDDKGRPGLFGHKSVLDWHANSPSNPDRKPFIWIHGVSNTKGSRTSWINMIEAYNDLSDKMKLRVERENVICGYQSGKYSTTDYFHEHVNYANPQPLVYTNEEGQKGLFFPFLQILDGIDKELYDELVEHVLQEKYMYHHDWEDGDVVISEQWLSIHKRWPFENMEERIVHRIAYDHSKLY